MKNLLIFLAIVGLFFTLACKKIKTKNEEVKSDGFPVLNQDLNALWKDVAGERKRASSFNPTGENNDAWYIPPDSSVLIINEQAMGYIARIWFTIKNNDSTYLDKVLINMWFDGEKTVDNVPFGMFFCTGPWRVNDVNTPVLNVMRARPLNSDCPEKHVCRGSYNSTWAMPFTESVKIEIVNRSSKETHLFFYVEYFETEIPDNSLLFHADYNKEHFTETYKAQHDSISNRTDEHNYFFTKIEGYRGRYVGTIMCVESHPDRYGKWYEGDDMFFIDGEGYPPTLHGTGTEDYFGMSWGFHRPYMAFDHGVTHFEKDLTPDRDWFYDGRYVTYRFHLRDPIHFYKSLRASIEHGHANDCEQHYESVAIWYGRKN